MLLREIVLEGGRFLSCSPKMHKVYDTILSLRDVGTVPVLIQGETGTGKELVARALHEKSARGEGPFIAVNCAAIPENLLESELFGYEKGAFTDAKMPHKGKIERAHKGTLLLDEIGDMHLDLQAKLLRVLQNKQVERVGGEQTFEVDVRIICTTNVSLKKLVSSRKFRPDLFWRIAVASLHLPPLRARLEDVVALALYYLEQYVEKFGFPRCPCLSKEALEKLKEHSWPGNVRELESVVQRALIYFPAVECLGPEHIILDSLSRGSLASMEIPYGAPLEEVMRHYILRVLEDFGGNKQRSARFLKISVRTLQNRLAEWSLAGLYKSSNGGC